ncbi:MAG: Acryloyl-CoA reductase electron transfer subunit beta [Firmicutes bacterium ADurb.Bin506]|nr:MAG: Acryloyl-CoA reductase electron transfer subunit beta [Firmicutes bacterium ADurb.Bin506]
MSVLILAEQRGGVIHPTTYELLARGRLLADKLGTVVNCAAIGCERGDQLNELIYRGADKVFLVDESARGAAWALPGPCSRALQRIIELTAPEVVVAAATTTGRTVMPLVAARLHTGLTADCTELDIDQKERLLLQTRPAIGGNIMATIKTPTARPQMATVRPKSCQPLSRDEARVGEVHEVSLDGYDLGLGVESLVEMVKDTTQEVNVQDAEIVVTGGKGVKNRDGFKLIEDFAAVMGAAVGATRDVVDLGWASYSHQIGLSGKTVSPRLYIAVGVSGSVQHLAGMQTSETIIAINKDKDAQIFKVADFGIVGDLFDVVPDIMARLKAGR